jgi:hypothetical protein
MALTTFRGLNKAFGVASVVAALAFGMMGGMIKTAQAQTVPAAVSQPWAIKLGVFGPANIRARQAGEAAIFSGEIEYTVQDLTSQNNSYSVLDAGYINEGHLRIIPLTVGQMFTDGRKSYFYGGGVGLYDVKMDLAGFTDDRDKFIFGLYGAVGLNVTQSIFIEAKYHYPYKYDNQFVGGVQGMVGLRF